MPFGRQGSFSLCPARAAQNTPGDVQPAWGWGQAWVSQHQPSWKGELICNTGTTQAQLRLATSGTLVIKTQRRKQNRATHREEDFQAGLPKVVPLGPEMGSWLQPRSQGPTKYWGGTQRHQNTSPQPNTQQAASSYRHGPTSLPTAPLPRARAGNPRNFVPASIPASAPLPKTAAAASCKEHCNRLLSSPTIPNLPQCPQLSSPT